MYNTEIYLYSPITTKGSCGRLAAAASAPAAAAALRCLRKVDRKYLAIYPPSDQVRQSVSYSGSKLAWPFLTTTTT